MRLRQFLVELKNAANTDRYRWTLTSDQLRIRAIDKVSGRYYCPITCVGRELLKLDWSEGGFNAMGIALGLNKLTINHIADAADNSIKGYRLHKILLKTIALAGKGFTHES